VEGVSRHHDTPLQEFPVLDVWTLCGRQSDDCNRSFSDVREGLEPARSLVIVFKKKSVVFKLLEDTFGDSVVMPFPMQLRPHLPGGRVDRPGIAFAQVNAESAPGKSFNQRALHARSTARTANLPLMVVSSSLILLRQVRFVRFNDRFETVLENAPILLGKRSDDHFLRPDS
jgi:hypothetical protein